MSRHCKLLDDWATVPEIAAEAAVHPRTVDRWCDAGELVWTTLGGRRIILRKKSRQALEARARQVNGRRSG